MSKNESKQVKATTGIAKVAAAISKAYETQATSGNVITQVCKICASVFKGKAPNSTDLKTIATTVTRLRGWSKASAGPRASEVRKIVRHYMRIPEAVTKYCAANDTFSWHDAMRLLTALNREPALNKALALMNKSNAAKAEAKPAKVMGLAISRIMNVDTRAAKLTAFQDALETLATKHGIDW